MQTRRVARKRLDARGSKAQPSGEEAWGEGPEWLIVPSRGSEVLKSSRLGCDKAEGHIYDCKGNSRCRTIMGIRLIISND